MNNLAHIHTALQNTANATVAANVRAELGFAGLGQTDLAAALGQNDMWLSRRLMDDLDSPNCPRCLHPMEPVVGAWWCPKCRVTVRPEKV